LGLNWTTLLVVLMPVCLKKGGGSHFGQTVKKDPFESEKYMLGDTWVGKRKDGGNAGGVHLNLRSAKAI